MPCVSCGCCVPSFLYRVYQPTLRRAEASNTPLGLSNLPPASIAAVVQRSIELIERRSGLTPFRL